MADLILAAKRGVLSKVLSELREGVPVDYQDEEQATALYWACCGGNQEICQLLLDHNANPNLPVKWGSTALHAASDRGHIGCMRLLFRYGAYVNAVNSSGDTALHLAAYRGRQEVCMLLVGHNADLSIVNKKGKTPQREAQAGEHMQIALLLANKKTDDRPKSFPLANNNGEQICYSAPLGSKQNSDWEYAHRSASYPLDHAAHPENGCKIEERQIGSDKIHRPSVDDQGRVSLRREVLHAPVSNRQNLKNCQYMTQASQEERHEFHLQHRPHSDTSVMMRKEMPNIDAIRMHHSEPSKQGNLAVSESEFQHRQKEAQSQHHAQNVEELQMKITVLSSQKETLEKKLLQNLDEESKIKLGKRVKELMSEVQQERRDRSEADSKTQALVHQMGLERQQKNETDARNRQLASELFQLRSLPKSSSLETVEDSSLTVEGRERGCVHESHNAKRSHDRDCVQSHDVRKSDLLNQESEQKQFAIKFCRLSGRTFLNSSSDLEHVCATLLGDQNPESKSMTTLKTTTCQKLESVASELAKRAVVDLNCELGQVWKKDADYTFVNDEPVDTQLRRCEDGLATEVVFRINCQSKMAAMKVWKKDADYTFVNDEPVDTQLRRCEDGLATEVVFRINCQSKMAAMKTTTCHKLDSVATELAKHAVVDLNCELSQVWTKDDDFTFVNDEPVDTQLRRCEDGLATEVVFRINCQSKMAAMKVILNHCRAPPMPDDVHFGSEWEILSTITPHANITRVLHWYSQPIADIREHIAPSHNASLGPLPKNVATLIMPEYNMTLKTLGTICSPTNAINERCLLRILLELAKAVNYLKTNGIVHRDIEPSKVFLDENLRVVLGDFGLARRLVNESSQPIPFVEKSQVMAGNVLAWAPELLQFNKDGPPKSYQKSLSLVDVYDSSDMYAIVTTLCHMTNQSSHEERSSTGFNSGSQSPLNQPQVPGFLSDEAQALLRGMLKENPRDRPTLQEVILRVSCMLFGPKPDNIKNQSDCEAWIHAQLLRLLAVAPTTQDRPEMNKDEKLKELARTAEWILCYEYVSNVTALQLWELCQD